MKKQLHNNNFNAALCAGFFILTLALTGCSDDATSTSTATPSNTTPTTPDNPFDHSHDEVVTDVEKHKFEHDFARQCVLKELENSTNKAEEEARWQEPCMCIAKYLMKDLTADEAEKFLEEGQNTQSLVIKFQSATFHCLQAKPEPKGPNLFGKPKQSG